MLKVFVNEIKSPISIDLVEISRFLITNSSLKKDEASKCSITYWLNLLQNLKCDEDIFLTLNPYFEIDKSKILKKVKFTHPYFDQAALDFQSKLINLQNKRNILFCGSYFGYGFHEDGIKSSIEMLKKLK